MDKILVFGHQNPDTDAITSAIVYAYFLNQKGIDSEPVALGEINGETAFALEQFGFKAPRVIHAAGEETKRVALVDHNEFQQSVADIAEVEIYSIVDHHRIGNHETANPLYYRGEPIGSTNSILYKMYNEQGIAIPENIAGLMLSGIVSDTLLFKSPTCTEEDVEIAKKLERIAGINLEEYGLEMLKAGTDVASKSAIEISEGDAKSFPFADDKYNLRVGQINTVDVNDVLDRKEEILSAMKELTVEHGYSAFILVVTNILDSNSVALVVGSDDIKEKIAGAFDKYIVEDVIDLPGVVSRKKQVVPNLTEAFNK